MNMHESNLYQPRPSSSTMQSVKRQNSHCAFGSTVHIVGIGGADHPAPKFVGQLLNAQA